MFFSFGLIKFNYFGIILYSKTANKHDYEELGFFLAIDRDRNGNIIRRIERNGPADRAGMRDGDRILKINGINAEKWSHEQLVGEILKAKNDFALTVIDERSDDARLKNRPFIFRIMKAKGGYGFYMWNDTDGHYVENVTAKSPADKAGLRAGDRILEINGVNIEHENPEDVFYRIKACHNMVTLLSVDAKTFGLIRKNRLSLDKMKAELGFSGYKDWIGRKQEERVDEKGNKVEVTYKNAVIFIVKDKTIGDDSWGFHLANQISFMGNDDHEKSSGHVIHWVEKAGAADHSGLRDGDKVLEINDTDVAEMDYEDVMELINGITEEEMKLKIEYEDVEETFKPRNVEINKTDTEELGFILWFDENGHYIEDVTIGTPAYKAGLRQGDRLVEVNHHNVELEDHEAVVQLVIESGNMVTLNVQSVKNKTAGTATVERIVHLEKGESNSFGFSINKHEDEGYYVKMLAEGGPAEVEGVKVGDRVLEINRDALDDMPFEDIVGKIKSSPTISLTILTQHRTEDALAPRKGDAAPKEKEAGDADAEIIKTLMGEQKVDYVVKPRFLQQKRDEKRGTDMRKKTKINQDLADQPLEERAKKKKKKKGITFGDTEIAIIGEDGGVEKVETKPGMLKHRSRRKKKPEMDEKEMAEMKANKRAKTMADVTKAMRKRTLENRERVIDKAQAKEDRRQEKKEEGGKRKSSLKKTETKTEPTGEKWDWEDDADDGNLEDIEEEKE